MTSLEETIEFIEHYGKKGMHWGVRRTPKKTSSDFKKTEKLRGKKASELSDKQLKDISQRMNLEQNFNRLNPSTVKKGTKVAAEVLATAGLAFTAYNMINSPAGQKVASLGKKAISKIAA
jgi:hypothetical protein